METINASELKARLLAVLDEVASSGRGVTILKRGRPVAQLLPVTPRDDGHPQATLAGTVQIHGDIVDPVVPADAWEANLRS
jgi:prevent-host-death family protein